MRSFDNLKRWRALVEYINSDPQTLQALDDLLRSKANEVLDTGLEFGSLDGRVEELGYGRNRDLYRIGVDRSHTIPIARRGMVLAVKLPNGLTGDIGPAVYESEAQLESFDHNPERPIYRVLKEVNCFHEYAERKGRARYSDIELPWVTGIIAGYGLVGVLTEDVTRGGNYELLPSRGRRVRIRNKRSEVIREVYSDLKWEHPDKDDETYMKERLQVDKMLRGE
jgi:hypothetical protein